MQLSAGSLASRSLGGASREIAEEHPAEQVPVPLKIGHRAASMGMVGDPGVFRLASQIEGIDGVELQIATRGARLRDRETVLAYKKEAHRWGIAIPSVAGVWDPGVSVRSPAAGLNLIQSIQTAELLGSYVVLVAFFRDNAPDMSREDSYGPVVEVLQKASPFARNAGVVLGLETSLSPSDNALLVDLVDSPNIRVYYDAHNMAYYGHGEKAISGISLLGKERICQVHVKNQEKLIEEDGLIDWRAAFEALNEIEYDGWYVFESRHTDPKQLLRSTGRNIDFMRRHCRMPLA